MEGAVLPDPVELPDLREVIRTLGAVSPNPSATAQALQAVGLYGQEEQAVEQNATSRWHSAIKVALENEGAYLRSLLNESCARLPKQSRRKVEEAVRNAGIAYVERILHVAHPELHDQVETLHRSRTYSEIRTAAGELRDVGLEARRMLMDSQLGTELALQLGTIDPGRRREELANLAIDVVTATDYLLSLVDDHPLQSRKNFLAENDLGPQASPIDSAGRSLDEDLRYRRVLDSRAAAVRLGGQLLRELQSATVAPVQDPC
jgi:hypothetical protein